MSTPPASSRAAANIMWIIFLLSFVGLVVSGARMLIHRRMHPAG